MPKSHREYCEMTPEKLIQWGESIGSQTAKVVTTILSGRSHPAQGFRSCLGILRLGKKFGVDRLEKACARALAIQALSYKSIHSILKNGLERLPLPVPEPEAPCIDHRNIRGAPYFN
jgi:hypothetical protein